MQRETTIVAVTSGRKNKRVFVPRRIFAAAERTCRKPVENTPRRTVSGRIGGDTGVAEGTETAPIRVNRRAVSPTWRDNVLRTICMYDVFLTTKIVKPPEKLWRAVNEPSVCSTYTRLLTIAFELLLFVLALDVRTEDNSTCKTRLSDSQTKNRPHKCIIIHHFCAGKYK